MNGNMPFPHGLRYRPVTDACTPSVKSRMNAPFYGPPLHAVCTPCQASAPLEFWGPISSRTLLRVLSGSIMGDGHRGMPLGKMTAMSNCVWCICVVLLGDHGCHGCTPPLQATVGVETVLIWDLI